MNKKKVRIILLVVVLIGGIIAYTQLSGRWSGQSDVIKVSGNFEITEVALSFRLPGWVKERPLDEGMPVHKGEVVALLDTQELSQEAAQRDAEMQAAKAALAELEAGSRSEEKAQAQAMVDRAAAALAELQAGSRPEEIAAAEAVLKSTDVEMARTKLDYERLDKLNKQGAVGAQELDTARSAYDTAKAKFEQATAQYKLVKAGPRAELIDQAKAALNDAKEHNKLVQAGPREETKQQARARVHQLEQSLELAKTRLSYAVLKSPVDGIVLTKNTEPGEFVAAGTPIVTVGDLKDIWLRAYVSDTDLGKIRKPNLKVIIRTDTYPDKTYEGKITFVSDRAEFTPKNVQTTKERVKQVYRIKISVVNPDLDLLPGMPADAEIFIKP